MIDAERSPVIIGVGEINDRDDRLDPLDLMEAALRRADADAGGGWLTRLDALGVVAQISFPELGDVPASLAARIGAAPRRLQQTAGPNGDGPVRVLDAAAGRIASGESSVEAVAGGEALRTAARRRPRTPRGPRHGLVAPAEVYPLYENACRAAWGQTLAEGQRESAAMWAAMSEIAADNEGAWLREARSAEEIATPSPENRPIAFPYTKLTVANAAVNMGAAFIVASLAAARAAGIPDHRLVHVGHGAAAREPEDWLVRDRYDHSASMAAALGACLQRNAATADDLDFAELYSCFPCVPKMARRAIGWPAERPATVYGGLTFGGGPIGNAMSHAIAAMTRKLRDGDGERGLIFANGGYATHNHSIVLQREPTGARRDSDVQAEADAARGPVPALDPTCRGAATIETYTVLYDRDGAPRYGVVVARSQVGGRLLAKVVDRDIIAFLTDGAREPVGTSGAIVDESGDAIWRG